jgi:hypothetical protein
VVLVEYWLNLESGSAYYVDIVKRTDLEKYGIVKTSNVTTFMQNPIAVGQFFQEILGSKAYLKRLSSNLAF